MKIILLVALFQISLSTRAMLSQTEQDYISTEISAGRISSIDQLRIDDKTLEEAKVDVAKLVALVRSGDTKPLADKDLRLAFEGGIPSPQAFLHGVCANMGGCYCNDGHGVPWNATCSWGRSRHYRSHSRLGCNHIGKLSMCL